MREHLLGYLLGALDAQEQESVERRLESDAELRQTLTKLQTRVLPLRQAVEEFEPPPGLAARTCDYVLEQSVVMPAGRGLSTAGDPPAGRHWSLADFVVAAGVLVGAVLLFLPAIANSRDAARITACQNNLRELGTALITYSGLQPDRLFPQIPTEGKRAFAGVVVPTLVENGLLLDQRLLICPDSSFAAQANDLLLTTFARIDAASAAELQRLQRETLCSYGYNLGYMQDGRLEAPHHEGRSYFPLMTDAPSRLLPGQRSANHGGKGIATLYDDGHVTFISGAPSEALIDHPFLSRRGHVEAGVDRFDAVIGPSEAGPILRTLR